MKILFVSRLLISLKKKRFPSLPSHRPLEHPPLPSQTCPLISLLALTSRYSTDHVLPHQIGVHRRGFSTGREVAPPQQSVATLVKEEGLMKLERAEGDDVLSEDADADRGEKSAGKSMCGGGARPMMKTARDYFERLCKGLPVEVLETADAGRGVFARRDIRHGDAICVTVPVVAHPTLENTGKVCHLCLRTIGSSSNEKESTAKRKRLKAASSTAAADVAPDERPRFCSSDCEELAREDFYDLEERAGGLREVRAHCRRHGLRFPLVCARLACMVVSGAATPSALQALCYARTPDGSMPLWQEEHALLLAELAPAVAQRGSNARALDFLTQEWYSEVMSRLHLNSFRVEMLPQLGQEVDLLAMAAAAVQQTGAAGTAIYLLPSMFNHDCDPNVNVVWTDDATVKMEARTDIAQGEELRITYLDASMGLNARRSQLQQSYGFLCTCGRCSEGD